ncbi:MAG TPA: hypothetical protein VK211_18335 [Kamptonema sp.]|nr:hypothetical protein [Kamptonema sp.]
MSDFGKVFDLAGRMRPVGYRFSRSRSIPPLLATGLFQSSKIIRTD